MDITITEIAALLGMLLGTVGSVLSVMNYLRDRPKVKVTLHWDRVIAGNPLIDSNTKWGVVNVTNEGRRPVYISHVALKLPRGYEESHLLLSQGVRGQKLAESDPPAVFTLDQDNMEPYGADWKKIRAQVSSSTGKTFMSKRVKKKPSWATQSENSTS